MENAQFKTDSATDFITKALDDFLRDKKLQLTTQQHEKLKKLLMVRLLEEEMSYANAYNHLNDIMEYRKDYEINANALEEAEEEMIRIIGAADIQEKEVIVETARYKKRFIATIALLALFCVGIVGLQAVTYFKNKNTEMTAVITTAEEQELKALVQKLVELEKSRGQEITHNAIYNQIKKLESVQSLGTATSYKKFNRAQYDAAMVFLNKQIID